MTEIQIQINRVQIVLLSLLLMFYIYGTCDIQNRGLIVYMGRQ